MIYLSVEQAVDNLLIKLLKDDETVEIVPTNLWFVWIWIQRKKQYLTVCVPERNITNRLLDNILSTDIKCLYSSANCQSCSRELKVIPKFGNHIFFNIINLNNTKGGQFTDSRLRLYHIPKYIKTLTSMYYFRGSITTPDKQQETISHTMLGHYHAHTYRHPINIWQIYDDCENKVHSIKENTQVNVQILMYSKLTEVRKFFYLKAALSGEAAEVVRCFETSATNYKIAWDCLNERYNNKRIMVQAHTKAIFDNTLTV